MKASHWIIEEVLNNLGNADTLPEICQKFGKRYPNDSELKSILCSAVESMTSSCDAEIENVRESLEILANKRKSMQGSGGTELWMPDRRSVAGEKSMR